MHLHHRSAVAPVVKTTAIANSATMISVPNSQAKLAHKLITISADTPPQCALRMRIPTSGPERSSRRGSAKPRQQGRLAVFILLRGGCDLRIDAANLRGLGNT